MKKRASSIIYLGNKILWRSERHITVVAAMTGKCLAENNLRQDQLYGWHPKRVIVSFWKEKQWKTKSQHHWWRTSFSLIPKFPLGKYYLGEHLTVPHGYGERFWARVWRFWWGTLAVITRVFQKPKCTLHTVLYWINNVLYTHIYSPTHILVFFNCLSTLLVIISIHFRYTCHRNYITLAYLFSSIKDTESTITIMCFYVCVGRRVGVGIYNIRAVLPI